MRYTIDIRDNAGAPLTGKSPAFTSFIKLSDLTSPSAPTITEIGSTGLYYYDYSPTESHVWMLDVGDVALTADRRYLSGRCDAEDHLAAELTTVDGVVDAIKLKTDNLPSDPASETNVDAVETKVDTITTRIGTPANIDSGGATLADNLKKICDDNGGADYDATVDSLEKNSLKGSSLAELPATTDLPTNPTMEQALMADYMMKSCKITQDGNNQKHHNKAGANTFTKPIADAAGVTTYDISAAGT